MSRLLLVRHGNTEGNSAERYWGRNDIKLDDAGFKQAEQLSHHLAAEKIGAVYASDMSRALVTAEVIAAVHRLEVIPCTELREIDFGEFEGLTFAEISRSYPEVAKLWAERDLSLKFPGGESSDEFDKRVGKFMSRLGKHAAEETVLIVAHAGTLRVLLCRLLGIDIQHRWQFRLDLASLSVVDTYPQGAMSHQ